MKEFNNFQYDNQDIIDKKKIENINCLLFYFFSKNFYNIKISVNEENRNDPKMSRNREIIK